MNKKFFAALASATMAFTASGSIAVFADDFVEEKTPVVDGNVVKPEETVKWNEDNFGGLVNVADATWNGKKPAVDKDGYVTIDSLKAVEKITLQQYFEAEIKGLEYFTGLKEFDASNGVKVENEKLDFSANTKLETLIVKKAPDLAEIVLPEAFVNDKKEEEYSLKTLTLEGTKLTSLDLSKYEALKDLTVTNSKLKALDLSALTLNNVMVAGNKNLAEVALNNGKAGKRTTLASLDLSGNTLETVNLDYVDITGELKLGDNHIGALDLSKTTAGTYTLGNQTFYVSEKFGTVNLAETFENFDVEKVTAPTDTKDYNKETGVLTLTGNETVYKYKAGNGELTVKLIKANPMHRLYNPNSGEHFYTADLEEKEALVKLGWNDEGYGWVADATPSTDDAKTKQAVYRLYNPNAGDHHYTMDENEVKTLVVYGWKDEGTGWYSATGDTVEVYRQYNPYANGAGSHNYTTDKAENDYLVSLGWIYEGAAWSAKR